jgi:hypothetical protein
MMLVGTSAGEGLIGLDGSVFYISVPAFADTKFTEQFDLTVGELFVLIGSAILLKRGLSVASCHVTKHPKPRYDGVLLTSAS